MSTCTSSREKLLLPILSLNASFGQEKASGGYLMNLLSSFFPYRTWMNPMSCSLHMPLNIPGMNATGQALLFGTNLKYQPSK